MALLGWPGEEKRLSRQWLGRRSALAASKGGGEGGAGHCRARSTHSFSYDDCGQRNLETVENAGLPDSMGYFLELWAEVGLSQPVDFGIGLPRAVLSVRLSGMNKVQICTSWR